MKPATHCRRCTIPLVPNRHTALPPRGTARHEGRGLCGRCIKAARQDGTLHTYPPLTRPRADTRATWQQLRDTHTRTEVAALLGMTRHAFDQAIYTPPGPGPRPPAPRRPQPSRRLDHCTLDEGEES